MDQTILAIVRLTVWCEFNTLPTPDLKGIEVTGNAGVGEDGLRLGQHITLPITAGDVGEDEVLDTGVSSQLPPYWQ
jgi:hypothetical protein